VLAVRRIEVGEGSLEAVIFVTDQSYLRTSHAHDLAERAVELLPGLRRHSCDNEAELDFVRELRDTESAHLLEHVACELMALAGSPRSLRGRTSWDFARDGRGVFRISLEFDDDLVAMGALDEAVRIVEWLLAGADRGAAPDVDAVVARLARLRTV
jgi:hypothetical protein